MNLLDHDLQSVTWDRLRADLGDRIAALRRKNDGDLDAADTARLRGQIAEVQYWLNLSAPLSSRDEPAGTLK